jgi:hypothetical protein
MQFYSSTWVKLNAILSKRLRYCATKYGLLIVAHGNLRGVLRYIVFMNYKTIETFLNFITVLCPFLNGYRDRRVTKPHRHTDKDFFQIPLRI